MSIQTVNVTYDSVSGDLTVSPLNVDLQAGDRVFWQFNELPPGCVGGIHFETPLGPFSSIRLLTPKQFVAIGNVGLPQGVSSETYLYRAQVLDASGSRAVSRGTLPTVTNLSQQRDTSPQIIVQIDPSTLKPVAQQRVLSLNTGDTATWHIFGLPADHFVTLYFQGFNDPLLGPFQSAFWSRAVTGDDPNEIRGSAAGFGLRDSAALAALGPQIEYWIQVRSAQGQVLSYDDPVIDDLGEPAPPGASE